jgi:hypothetical protein
MAQVRIQLIASPSFVAAVDDWRRKQPDIPNRSESIRRLVLGRLAIAADEPRRNSEAG